MVKTSKINYPYYIAGTIATLTLLTSVVFAAAPYIGFLAPIVALNLSLPLIAVCALLSSVVVALSAVAIKKNKAFSVKETELTDKTKELDNKVKESQAKVAELDQKAEEQNHTISEKDARLVEKTEEIKTLLAEKEEKQQHNIEVQTDNSALEELNEQLKQKEQEFKNLSLGANHLKSELNKKEKNIQELTSEVNKVQSEKQGLSASVNQEVANKSAELEKLRAEYNDLEKNLREREKSITELQSEIYNLNARKIEEGNDYKKEIADLQNCMQEKEKRITEFSKLIKERQQQLDTVLDEKVTLSREVQELERRNGQIFNAEAKIQDLHTQLHMKGLREGELANEMQELKGYIGSLRQENAQLKNGVKNLEKKLKRKQNALDQKEIMPLVEAAGKNLKTKVVNGAVKTAKWGAGIAAVATAGAVISHYGYSPEVSSGVSNFNGAGNDVGSTLIINPLSAENNNSYPKVNVDVNYVNETDQSVQDAIGKHGNMNNQLESSERVYGKGSFPGPQPSFISSALYPFRLAA